MIEERTSSVARVSMVWSPVYTNALITRDRDSDTNGSLEERLYVAHDANWNASSILTTSAGVQERYLYDPFGAVSFKDASYGARGSSSFAWSTLAQGLRLSTPSSLYWNGVSPLSSTLGLALVLPYGQHSPRLAHLRDDGPVGIAEKPHIDDEYYIASNQCPTLEIEVKPGQPPRKEDSFDWLEGWCKRRKIGMCKQQCKSAKEICEHIQKLAEDKKQLARLSIFGHGCGEVGVACTKGDFKWGTISDDCAKAIGAILKPGLGPVNGGILRMCSCSNAVPRRRLVDDLIDLAGKLKVTVCGCTDLSHVDFKGEKMNPCGCTGRWICCGGPNESPECKKGAR